MATGLVDRHLSKVHPVATETPSGVDGLVPIEARLIDERLVAVLPVAYVRLLQGQARRGVGDVHC